MSDDLELINWPTLEDMTNNSSRSYTAVQVEFDGKRYYRFVTPQSNVKPHESTKKLAEKKSFVGMKEKLDGHAVALDAFVRELIKINQNPMEISVLSGFDARYFPINSAVSRTIDFYIEGMSGRYGKPDLVLLKKDLEKSVPNHLKLHFHY